MKIYSIKDLEKNLYFRVERNKDVLKIIDDIAAMIFDEYDYEFASTWQGGLPGYEDQESFRQDEKYLQVIIGKDSIHITIVGLGLGSKKEEVKKSVLSKFEFVNTKLD